MGKIQSKKEGKEEAKKSSAKMADENEIYHTPLADFVNHLNPTYEVHVDIEGIQDEIEEEEDTGLTDLFAGEEDFSFFPPNEQVDTIMVELNNSIHFPPRNRITRIPSFLKDKDTAGEYTPKVLCIGPYHHENRDSLYSIMQNQKLDLWAKIRPRLQSTPRRHFEVFLQQANEWRGFYDAGTTDSYSDAYFARMLMYDGLILVAIMKAFAYSDRSLIMDLDEASFSMALRDTLLLENQIPATCLRDCFALYNGDLVVSYNLFTRFLNRCCSMIIFSTGRKFSWKDVAVPLMPKDGRKPVPVTAEEDMETPDTLGVPTPRGVVHGSGTSFMPQYSGTQSTELMNRSWRRPVYLLEVIHHYMAVRSYHFVPSPHHQYADYGPEIDHMIIARPTHAKRPYFRSAKELKKNGILCQRSSAPSPTQIIFRPHTFSGTLLLPTHHVRDHTRAFFTNLVALEYCCHYTAKNPVVSTYVEFMKTLLVTPEDAGELRRAKVIDVEHGTDEKIVELFQSIDTFGMSYHAKTRAAIQMQGHLDSVLKTWTAELFWERISRPWKLACLVMVALQVAQLVFSVKQSHG